VVDANSIYNIKEITPQAKMFLRYKLKNLLLTSICHHENQTTPLLPDLVNVHVAV
jgi:hypothetical protein